MMADVFGEAALGNHTVVLFTRGDDLEESMEQYLACAPARLEDLIRRCGGRYHVFNNRIIDVNQVDELLSKVEKVMVDNGGKFYTKSKEKRDMRKVVRVVVVVVVLGVTVVAACVLGSAFWMKFVPPLTASAKKSAICSPFYIYI
ncbi:unnamed protein product [Gadus morhua 'NCC']